MKDWIEPSCTHPINLLNLSVMVIHRTALKQSIFHQLFTFPSSIITTGALNRITQVNDIKETGLNVRVGLLASLRQSSSKLYNNRTQAFNKE